MDQKLLNQFTEQLAPDPESPTLTLDVVDAICQSCLLCTEPASSLIESLSIQADTVRKGYFGNHGLPVIPAPFPSELWEKQRAESILQETIHQMETGEKVLPTAREELPQIPFLVREISKLVLIDGILCRKRQDNEHISHQLVLPDELRSTVLHSLHDDMDHMGVDRTLDLARTRFY